MMISTKSIKVSKRTFTMTFQSLDKELCNLEKYEAVAIALMTGFYNPLRKVSRLDAPINLDKMAAHQEKFNAIINDIITDIEVDVEDIEKIVG